MIAWVFRVLAMILGCGAIYLLWSEPGSDYTFALVVLAISAAFLSYRFHIKDRLNRHTDEAADRTAVEE
jgi:hypothetical protein